MFNQPVNGGRNLTILGLVSIALAIFTTAISLIIYHNSGDIYLDRSRPGFLPEEKEEGIRESNYVFDDEGTIDAKALDEYLENIEIQLDNLKRLGTPYDPIPLSDESLGIPDVNMQESEY